MYLKIFLEQDIKLMFDINTVVIYGFTFGIVAMTIFYTLIRGVYSKEFIYLSYALMQLFSLVFILSYSQLFFSNDFLQELSLTFATLFAFAFAVGFYQGSFFPKINNQKELLGYTFIFILIVLTAFYHYLLFEYLPYTVIYFILFISVAFNYQEGIKPTFIYVIGWSLLCLFLYFTNFKELYIQQGYIDIVLLAFCIEAILFTLSVAYKYNELHNENKDYQQQLLHQSRLVQTGQMIANITHQYRQPLNNLSYILMNLSHAFKHHKLTLEYFDKKLEQANSQLSFMSKTIDDFKAFYTPCKEKKDFLVQDAIAKAITIIQAELKEKNIMLHFDATNEHITIFGIENELSQVVLTLLSNAKDALIHHQNPQIDIYLSSNSSEVMVCIEDNGSGIQAINKIFTPYYTTKNKGFGIGLTMAKTIIEQSFKGRIEAVNTKKGAKFTLFFEKSI